MRKAEFINGEMIERDMTAEEIAEHIAFTMPSEADYVNAIQAMLDATPKERRYFGMQSASTYAASTNPTFKAEADALLAWRDAVWVEAYRIFDKVTAGAQVQPTIPDLLAMLPTFSWPT